MLPPLHPSDNEHERHRPPAADEPPPFLGTWTNVYRAVVLYLIALIALFAWFTHAFRVVAAQQ